MYKVKIFGAGSIGNHLAHGCRQKGWQVLMCDKDPAALERTRRDIYPERYGDWDEMIRLATPESAPDEAHDLVIIGTPPDTHVPLALEVLKNKPPKVLLIEKPLCTPDLKGCDELWEMTKTRSTTVLVGYNHTLTPNTVMADDLINNGKIERPLTISAKCREHWGGIFGAHPWLNGPQDTYLGYYARGGGACCEHSHSINIWQHMAHTLDMGRVAEVTAVMDLVSEGSAKYDQLCQLHLKTEKGLVGLVVQDVITEPAQKELRIQGENGFIEWCVNMDAAHDAVSTWDGTGDVTETLFPKSRPDDFKGEIDHIETILKGGAASSSPISLERGLETMLVIAAAFKSAEQGRKVTINYNAGFNTNAVQTI